MGILLTNARTPGLVQPLFWFCPLLPAIPALESFAMLFLSARPLPSPGGLTVLTQHTEEYTTWGLSSHRSFGKCVKPHVFCPGVWEDGLYSLPMCLFFQNP